MSLRENAEQLQERKERIRREMGGPDKVARQHAMGKLTVRERLDLLFDPGTLQEYMILAHHDSQHPDLRDKETPADGIITGWGRVDGRKIFVVAYDFTVLAGSIGKISEHKHARLRQLAARERAPIVWLLDSAGARVQELTGSQFAETGHLFYEQVMLSGVVPQVAAMMGPCAAGTAYLPALSDFVPMVKGTASMALGGAALVKAAIGEDIDDENLGGSKVHCYISGVADLEVPDDAACIKSVKDFLSFMPGNCESKPPRREATDPIDRLCPELEEIVPDESRQPFDVHKVITTIVDHGEFFEIKPTWARNLVVGFARFGGRPVGIVANNPAFMGGVLDVNSADKAARFINLCDAFNIPLVFLQDVPGFMIGSAVEKQGIIRHGAKMLYSVCEASVPKITVVMRKAYGAGYLVMNSKIYEADLIVAWPKAEISVMGPEGAAYILFRKEIAAAATPEEAARIKAEKVAQYRQAISPATLASNCYVDDVIAPEETRRVICYGLEMAESKQVFRYKKKHGVIPV